MSILSDELTNDPLARGYSGMTDAQAMVDLNTSYRPLNRAAMSGDEIFNASDAAEFAILTDVNKDMWLSFCGRDSIDPFATANVAFVQWLFGPASITVSQLAADRVITQTRGNELGLGILHEGDIVTARAP